MASDPPSELRRAERQFARSVLGGLLLLGLVALAGPLLSYRSDVQEMRGQFHARIAREAGVYAEALGLHLQLLKSELGRVATGVGPELSEEVVREDLGDLTAPDAGLFRQGLLLLDDSGETHWSEPSGLLEGEPLRQRAWFRRVLARQSPTVDALAPGESTFIIAVPVVRQGKTEAILAGLLDASVALPGAGPPGEHRTLLVLNRAGDLFLPRPPPDWASASGFAAKVETLLAEGGQYLETGRRRAMFASAMRVPGTELRLVLAADEAATLDTIRGRLLVQLLALALLQLGTLLLFALHWRRVYRVFMEVERRSTEKETMAVLGSAASLIAHEVKNSLNGLKAATGLLSGPDAQGFVGRALRGQIDRLAHLATSLLHFGKPPYIQRTRVELPRLVHEVLEGLRLLPEAEEVRVEMDLPEELELSGDPLLLATALDNLVRNAMEAAVAAKDLGQVDSPRVRVHVRRQEDAAVVDVEDNAGGPPPGFEDRLFEPFATHKPKGVGLGLTMARRAVEQQGGTLGFTRIPGGSRFTLRMPLRESQDPRQEQLTA